MNNEIDELCLTRPAALQRFFMREGVAEKSAIRLCQEAFGDKQITDIHTSLSWRSRFIKKEKVA